jgi:hypothetical protein
LRARDFAEAPPVRHEVTEPLSARPWESGLEQFAAILPPLQPSPVGTGVARDASADARR